ncbi:MAG: hypothetical protein HGB01_11670 [Chlorobiaceae bacterium]|nr:hypothetical protein [Chlorobiales bacterium]NTV26853.1 hypothetical protein [Chlorobiaceae bacterium]
MLTTKNGGALFGKVPAKTEPMMKITLLKSCVVAGTARPEGWSGDCPQSGAKYLINKGKAVAYVAPADPDAPPAGNGKKDGGKKE